MHQRRIVTKTRGLAAATLCVGAPLTDAATVYVVTGRTGVGGMLNTISQTVVGGEKAVFLVRPNTGYMINTVTGCGGKLSGMTYTTGVITNACTVTATFKIKMVTTYSLTLKTKGTGSGTVSGSGVYAAGTTATLRAIPASGSTFTGWSPAPCAPNFPMPAKALTCTATFTKASTIPVPPTVKITGGCFSMGSPEDEPYHNFWGDETLHEVCVNDFAMGKYEVTFEEYDAFTEATGREEASDIGYDYGGKHWGRGKRPVINVSWNDAVAYTQWLSEKTGHTYRLPTEAEWEYAARAGTTAARYWGDDDNSTQACAYENIGDKTISAIYGWPAFNCADGYAYTAPVGSFKPNPWSLYDMLGNVSEWTCSDQSPSHENEQKCSTNGASGDRSTRGADWGGGTRYWVRVAYRSGSAAVNRSSGLGFRVIALVPEP